MNLPLISVRSMIHKKRKMKDASKGRDKNKKLRGAFFDPLVVVLLVFITIFLTLLLTVELAQIALQYNMAKKAGTYLRPVYVVDSQPVDIDAYLREYFTNKKPQKTMPVNVSAYSSTKDQTDGTPYHTAVGTPVRDGIVAANFLPIGTVVRFPDKFGDKLFVVEDRMDERFSLQVDIWMSDRQEAKKFGIQYLTMEVY